MATKALNVGSRYLASSSLGGWFLRLRGNGAADPRVTWIATIGIADDEATQKPAVATGALSYVDAWFRREEMPTLIDVLRNEKQRKTESSTDQRGTPKSSPSHQHRNQSRATGDAKR